MPDLTKLKFSPPRLDHDKILGTLSGTINVPGVTSPTSSVTVNDVKNTGFNDTVLVEGIYSVDGGATWNDMGAMVPNLSNPSTPVFQTLDCIPSSSPNGNITITATNYLNFVTGSTPAKTVLYKVVLIAKSDQGSVEPLPIASSPLRYSSRFNFQKIFREGSTTLSVPAGSTNSVSVNHGLGYVPNLRMWLVNGSNITIVPYSVEVRLDNNNVTFFNDNTPFFTPATYNLIYRIYYDG